jgi:ribosomal protein S18 acetylase RimI-like enzyme
MSLHDRIEAAVRERMAVAQAATPGPWAIWRDLDFQGFYTVGDEAGVIAEGEVYIEGEVNPTAHVYVEPDAEFIAANDPARILRDCAEDLGVLRRHRPCVGHCETVPEDSHQVWCHRCSTGQLPCPEVLSLGRRCGITEENSG